VNGFRHQLFPHTGFSEQKHRRLRRRDIFDLLVQGAHRRAAADEISELAVAAQFRPQPRQLRDVAEDNNDARRLTFRRAHRGTVQHDETALAIRSLDHYFLVPCAFAANGAALHRTSVATQKAVEDLMAGGTDRLLPFPAGNLLGCGVEPSDLHRSVAD